MDEGMLKGVRILDLSRVLAGPYCTRILGDFGAEIIKIQSKKTALGTESNGTPYFSAWNRNKRSIMLDMDYPEAKGLFVKLVEVSDVVVENFSPRVMSNWGFGYDRLKDAKEDLVMLSMSGAGQTGPWKDFVAFAPTVHSLGGMTYLTSFSKDSPCGLGFSFADLIAGLYGAFAVLVALEHRGRTGAGQYIDLSEYEAMCTTLGPTLLDVFVNGNQILPMGNSSGYLPAAPYGCYRCMGDERWCVIAVFGEEEWQALCDVLGNPEWTKDEKFSSLPKRKEHGEELDNLLEEWTERHPVKEAVAMLQTAGVPAGIVQNAGDLARDPQLFARDFFADLMHPVLGATKTDTFPILFNGCRQKPLKPAPLLGEDNQYVYEGLLGLTLEEMDFYKERGIIA